MTRSTITRRAAFAAPLALAPLAAFGGGQLRQVGGSSPADPAVTAFAAWRAAVMNHEIVCRSGGPDEDNDAACHAISEPFYDLAEARATTPDGVRLQLLGTLYGIGEAMIGLPVDPLEWREEHFFESSYPHTDAAMRALWNALDALETMQGRGGHA